MKPPPPRLVVLPPGTLSGPREALDRLSAEEGGDPCEGGLVALCDDRWGAWMDGPWAPVPCAAEDLPPWIARLERAHSLVSPRDPALGRFEKLLAPLLPRACKLCEEAPPPWQARLLEGNARALDRSRCQEALKGLTASCLPDSSPASLRLRAIWTALALASRAIRSRCLQGLPSPHPSWLGEALLPSASTEIPPALEAHLDGFAWRFSPGRPPGDVTGPLLMHALPPVLRHDLGEYFTPPWLARRVLEGGTDETFPLEPCLDPSCGAGGFLAEALALQLRSHARGLGPDLAARLPKLVRGIEANALSAELARCNLLLSLASLEGAPGLPSPLALPCPIHEGDSFDPELPRRLGAPFPWIVGNPPWIGWSSLAPSARQRLLEDCADFDFFEARGLEARLGFANDDVSIPFLLVCAGRWLSEGGQLAFLMKGALLQNIAGRSLRRFRVRRKRSGADPPSDVPLAVEKVEDFAALRPFGTAAADAVILRLRRDGTTSYPVPWLRAHPVGRRRVHGSPSFSVEVLEASPGDPADAASPWRLDAPGRRRDEWPVEGPSAYPVRHGLKHDCNGCFLVELLEGLGPLVRVRNRARSGRNPLPLREGLVEARFVHPLIRSRHVRKEGLSGHWHVILPHHEAGLGDEAALRREAPHLADWLEAFRGPLESRRSRLFPTTPFWAVYGIGPYSFAPWRVLWCGMGWRPLFLPVGTVDDPHLGARVPLLDGALYAMACASAEEACFVSALLESSGVRLWLAARSGRGKRGLPASLMKKLKLPAFDPSTALHRELAALGGQLASERDDEGNEALRAKLDELARRFYCASV